jgi:hypothetical protein
MGRTPGRLRGSGTVARCSIAMILVCPAVVSCTSVSSPAHRGRPTATADAATMTGRLNLSQPRPLVGESSCGTTKIAANHLRLLVFTRQVTCATATRLLRKAVTGRWPKHWWPREYNHGIWIQRGLARWRRSALRHNRHIRALYLPLGPRTLSVAAGDLAAAQYRPVLAMMSGDGSLFVRHTHWPDWTARRARGHGIAIVRTFRRSGRQHWRTSTTITATRPRRECGIRVFTRYRVKLAHSLHHRRRDVHIKRGRYGCRN